MIPGRRADLAWLAVATAVALCVVLGSIDGGELRTDDEALYGMLARTGLANDRWLYSVDVDGSYSEMFGKPPLSLWLVGASFSIFGPSPISLRLPFALGYVLTVVACFAWGRRIGGTAMGVAWALGLATCGAAVRWGRVACIEPLFLAPCVLALVAHGEALRGDRPRRAAVLAGIALAVAFLIKQLAVAIAVVPIVALELARRERGGTVARRNAIVLGVPVAVGIAWLLAAYAQVGDPLLSRLFGTGVLERIGGFASGHNLRQLDEVASILDDVSAPISWPLGVLGAALWACRDVVDRRNSGEPPGDAWTWPGLLVVSALLYDTVSSTLLPWYVFGLLVPVLGGAAWLVARFVAVAQRLLDDRPERPDALDLASAAAGAIVLATTAVAALQPLVSRVDAMLVVAVALVVCTVAAARRPSPQWLARAIVLAPVCTLVAMLGGRARSRELYERPGRFAALMSELARRDVARVAYDKDTKIENRLAITLFGVGAHKVARPPWGGSPADDAYVTLDLVPEEIEPPPGVELVRSPGAVAWIGDLSRAPWDRNAMLAALADGPLTWESEHLHADRTDTLLDSDDASGGAMRGVRPWRNERLAVASLAVGPSLELPQGKYQATLRMRWSCDGYDHRVGWVEIVIGDRKIKRDIECVDAEDQREWTEVTVPFKVGDERDVKLRVVHEFGGLWHDWTAIAAR